MNTNKYQIIKIVKEPGKEPLAYDWDCKDVHCLEDAWLMVYGKECGDCKREPISFLGTRYLTEEPFNLQVIHVTQVVVPEKTGCIFFIDVENDKDLCNLKTGFAFTLSGWLIPPHMIPEFLETYMDGKTSIGGWTPYYQSMKYFDDFEVTGKMLIAVHEQ